VPSLPQEDDSNDVIYVLKSKEHQPEHQEIVAALRLTRSKCDGSYAFLRSLCCAKEYRRQGLGVHLLQSSLDVFNTTSCYCFASSDLQHFYESAGFVRIQINDVDDEKVPKWMLHSYQLMSTRWNQKGKILELFVKQLVVQKSVTRIILLQHSEEVSKSNATGWLVDDYLYNQYIGNLQPSSVSLKHHVELERWMWSGRNDSTTIGKQIQQLAANSRVFLLWTGQNSDTATPKDTDLDASYIILDGTWQQAQSIYRRIESLWKLPRISLIDTQRSKYILRKDYTGWREKFSSNEDGGDLLCTAEVMAAVLDRRNNAIGATEIRDRLDTFQRYYPQIAAKRKELTSQDNVHK
jgi:DTW domain-containing protein YfiP/predicted GNAT family N-acyltransferase